MVPLIVTSTPSAPGDFDSNRAATVNTPRAMSDLTVSGAAGVAAYLKARLWTTETANSRNGRIAGASVTLGGRSMTLPSPIRWSLGDAAAAAVFRAGRGIGRTCSIPPPYISPGTGPLQFSSPAVPGSWHTSGFWAGRIRRGQRRTIPVVGALNVAGLVTSGRTAVVAAYSASAPTNLICGPVAGGFGVPQQYSYIGQP